MDVSKFLKSQGITKSYQTVRDDKWNEVTIEALLLEFYDMVHDEVYRIRYRDGQKE